MKYRREIDGLRAVAVLPVIIYHAGFDLFPAGFLGVDVFFVISGYLITLIISQEVSEGRFSVIDFYERRARRILPALFAMLAVTTIASWLILYPSDFKRYGESLFATAAFLSNVYFFITSDYFSPATELMPLIHTWSLAVEEQFYIFFPLLLLLLARFRAGVTLAVVFTLTVLSLGLAQFLIGKDGSATFYLLPTRAWELGCGALCALWSRKPARPRSNFATTVGLAMIIISMTLFETSVPTPSIWTTVPVLGTTLVIFFGSESGVAGRLLSARPTVAIGLLSYSAYLWHQPLMALTRQQMGIEPPWPVMLFLSILTFALAYLSWRFIEQPFRRRQYGPLPSRQSIFAASATGLIICLSLGLFLHFAKGLPGRMNAETAAILSAARDSSPKTRTCLVKIDTKSTLPELAPDACLWPSKTTQNKGLIVIVGDSHANAFAGSLSELLPEAGYDFRQVTVVGCAPFVGFHIERPKRDCHAANLAIENIVRAMHPERIILAWRGTNMYAEPFDNGEGGVDMDADGEMALDTEFYPDLATADRKYQAVEIFRRGIDRWAESSPLILVGPVPEAAWKVPQTYAWFRKTKNAHQLSTDRSHFEARNDRTLELLGELAAEKKADVVFPHDYLCNAERCFNARDEEVYYTDDDHLSMVGAGLITPAILDLLEKQSGSR
ncbi:acyltransferase family protein [Martelella mediterranea]|uniref:O-acetyltransferase OatA n=1 Tax=Martelella mediterranea DSM 17316 TaxID=1122214 RepID=A0A1U9Z7B3_9HYPH|nr:acyltransferase family protein [Martelella mediterranea]AQZ53568.1 O-acetyltransferase OatA [Martelella mediterranea DSM 17316]